MLVVGSCCDAEWTISEFLGYNPRRLMCAMNIEDGTDNWTEEDALSKAAASSKPGIYVPTVDRIRPYVPPTSRLSDESGTASTTGAKNDGTTASAGPLTQDPQSTSALDLNDSESDETKTANNDATQTKTIHLQPQSRRSMRSERSASNLELQSQEEADFLVNSALESEEIEDLLANDNQEPSESYDLGLLDFDEGREYEPLLNDAKTGFERETGHSVDDSLGFDALDPFDFYEAETFYHTSIYESSHDVDEEPLPTIEYDGDLHEALFIPVGNNSNFRRSLMIDEWIASIGDVDSDIVKKVSNILNRYSNQRFSNWMKWLKRKSWDELLLYRFFNFYMRWQMNDEYWVGLRYNRNDKYWYRVFNRYNLKRDHAFLIVERRIHRPTHMVLDDCWLDDWNSIDPWVLVKNGFFTFVDFAMYRSRLVIGEDWRRNPELDVDLSQPQNRSEYERSISEFAIGLASEYEYLSVPHMFSTLDWNDPCDWHDGLGW